MIFTAVEGRNNKIYIRIDLENLNDVSLLEDIREIVTRTEFFPFIKSFNKNITESFLIEETFVPITFWSEIYRKMNGLIPNLRLNNPHLMYLQNINREYFDLWCETLNLPEKYDIYSDAYIYQPNSVYNALLFKTARVTLATGLGKCHGINTPILMYDGTIKMVQDVVIGDIIMGDDSKKRNVLALGRGVEMMYDIIPKRGGESYRVNESHILSLRVTGLPNKKRLGVNGKFYYGGDIVDIELRDYLKLNKTAKHCLKSYQVGVDFEQKDNTNLIIDPRFLGLWLADGSKNNLSFTFHDDDVEVIDYIYEKANELCCEIRKVENSENSHQYFFRTALKKIDNPIYFRPFKELNLVDNKHIPHIYKTASRKVRLEILAGILDGDGSYDSNSNTFEITQKSEQLIDDIVFLSRSLGYCTKKKKIKKGIKKTGFVGEYFTTLISGNIWEIPTLLERKKTKNKERQKNYLNNGFSVVPVGVDDYYGFTIDGNHRYLLGDFTVTHNTLVTYMYCRYIVEHYLPKDKKILIIVPRKMLVTQTKKAFEEFNNGDVKIVVESVFSGAKKVENANIVLGTYQSLSNYEEEFFIDNFYTVICDELHTAKSHSIKDEIIAKTNACFYFGMTATFPEPNTLDYLNIVAMFGTNVYTKTTKEGIEDGNICPVKIAKVIINYNSEDSQYAINLGKLVKEGEINPTEKYREEKAFFGYHLERTKIISKLLNGLEVNNAVIMLDSVEYCERLVMFLTEQCPNRKIFIIHGKIKDAEREAIKEYMESNDDAILVATSSCIATGISINNIHYVFFVEGGKSRIRVMQSTGRGLRLHPKKEFLHLFDFQDNMPKCSFLNHNKERNKIYQKEKHPIKDYIINLK